MKQGLVLLAASFFAVGDMALDPEVASASTSYEGYVRCEDLKVSDLVPLRSNHSVSLKAKTTLGYTTVEKKDVITPDETKNGRATSFGLPATKTHAHQICGSSTAGYEVAIERDSKDSAALDVTICVAYKRLSPDGDDQKSETVGKASLLAGESKQLVWYRKSAQPEGQVYVVLVQPRSLNTSTTYHLAFRRRSS